MTELTKITISTNPWSVPDPAHALDGWLEGGATKREIRQARAAEQKAREAWKPSDEGLRLVDQLKAFMGTRVQIQFWDAVMFVLEEEGPFPLEGDCKDVILMQRDQFLQAFIVLDNIREIPKPEGSSPSGYLTTVDGIQGQLASLANVYEVFPVNPDGSVSEELQQQRSTAVKSYNERTLGVRELVEDDFTAEELASMFPLWPEEDKKSK